MSRWVWVAILSFMIIAGSGLASDQAINAEAPERVEHAGVVVELHILSAKETEDIFDVNLVRKRVQPLVIRIKNDSGTTYRFRKADVDEHYLPAATAAKQAYENPLVVGKGVAGRVLGYLPSKIFKSSAKVPERPVFNRTIQDSFVREEIPDGEIGSNGKLSGFLYVRSLEPGAPIRVTLINVHTQEPLLFEFEPSLGRR